MIYKKISIADGIEIVTDKETIKQTSGEVSLSPSDSSIKTALETKAAKSLPDLFVHKAQDGRIFIATGTEPTTWPDEMPEDKAAKYHEDDSIMSVDKDGNATKWPPRPPSFYGE